MIFWFNVFFLHLLWEYLLLRDPAGNVFIQYSWFSWLSFGHIKTAYYLLSINQDKNKEKLQITRITSRIVLPLSQQCQRILLERGPSNFRSHSLCLLPADYTPWGSLSAILREVRVMHVNLTGLTQMGTNQQFTRPPVMEHAHQGNPDEYSGSCWVDRSMWNHTWHRCSTDWVGRVHHEIVSINQSSLRGNTLTTYNYIITRKNFTINYTTNQMSEEIKYILEPCGIILRESLNRVVPRSNI